MKKITAKGLLSKVGLKPSQYSLKNITRIGKQRATSGWWVRIKNEEFKCSKTFYDKDYDGLLNSFNEAIKFRENQPKHIKSNTGYEYISITIQNSNYPVLKITIKDKEKAFIINQYGYNEILFRGINFRNLKLKLPLISKDSIDTKKGLEHLQERLSVEDFNKINF